MAISLRAIVSRLNDTTRKALEDADKRKSDFAVLWANESSKRAL